MEIGELGFCESCVLGKSHKQSFSKAKHTTKGILEYVHSDLWGSPSTPESLGGAKYFISFIDDYSKKLWVYFLRTKDEAFNKFKEWKEAVESHTEKRIKCLRKDNGLEFCNTLFDDLCRRSGIKRHRTCTYTPQQNGVLERMNRTIMDKVRSMLAETGLGQEFWAEVTATAVYLINRTPNSTIGFQLPEERWSGQKPDLTHLRRFGCTAYVHTIQEKISPRAVKGTFLGYPFGVKGYRVWLPEEGKCTTSRNVVFREDEVYKDLNSSSSSTTNDESTATHHRIRNLGGKVLPSILS
uniref:Retrovirus-related Pol polyprotein from transposon TNT 1-94 n=1 Tax=Noccaea caerulescens TaxID=107243 RepID=A0A1J3ITH4_NOCCA